MSLRRLILASSVLASIGLFAVPLVSQAATVTGGRILNISTTTPGNQYFAAESINVNSPISADLCILAGNIIVTAPIGGEALLAGGTVEVQRPVIGDARIAAGRVAIEDNVGGDLMVAGGFVNISGRAKDTRVIGNTIQITNGSDGKVVVYGNNIYLSGEFDGDVEAVASDRITLEDGTIIHGAFRYNAPEQLTIPSTVTIDKGVTYIGHSAFLPTEREAKTFAVAGLWVFWIVRLTAVLVVVGLIAGLFPTLTERVIESALTRSLERFILLTFLGFAGIIVTPILLIFLVVSFVGIGIALVIGSAYLLFLLLAYIFAYVLAGAALMRLFRKNKYITWRGALLGVLVLFVIGMIPYIGFIAKLVLAATAGGTLLVLAYRFAFRRNTVDLTDF